MLIKLILEYTRWQHPHVCALGDMIKVLHAKLNRLLLKVVPEDEHLCRVELVALQQAGVAKQLLSHLEYLSMDNCKLP